MRFLFWLIILATLAVGVTFLSDINTGYALFIVPPYRIDLSLNLFIIYLVLTVIVLYLVIKLIAGAIALPSKVKRWRARRKQIEARRQGYLAILALIEGRMQCVEQAAEKALLYEKNPEARNVILLTAAKAAYVRRDFAQRDHYLQAIEMHNNKLNIAAAMLKAELLADEKNDHEALKVLEKIRKASPKLISAMRLELRIQQRQQNAIRVIELADKLEQLDVLDPVLAEHIRHEAHLQHVSKLMNVTELKNWWSKLPFSAQLNPAIVLAMAKGLVLFEDETAAAKIIEDTLDQVWDSTLLAYYSHLTLHNTLLTNQLHKAEAWLKRYPNDAQLLLTLGRLCVASELWGKAQSYFEASLALHPDSGAHAELARLFEQLEQSEKANQHYRRSVELMRK